MADEGNALQREFWNAQPGLNWAVHQAELDALAVDATEALLEAAAPAAGERVLDIGCGAGASSFALARAVGAEGEVLGVDFSAPLLERAEMLRGEAGIPNVRFERGDAQVHRFDVAAFDLAASRFGMMFFADTVAALRNIGGALRPGGRLVFIAWAGPERNPWFTVPQEVAVRRLGPAEPSPPDAPGPMAFRDVARVVRLMREAGFADCAAEAVDVDLHLSGGVEAAADLAQHVGPIARMLRDKGGTEADRTAIAEALRDEFARFRSPDGIRVPAVVTLFRGLRR